MKSLRKAMKTSAKLEVEGIEYELANTRVRLARAGGQNVKFNAAMSAAIEKHKRAIDLKILNDDKALAVLAEIYAEFIVLKWETNVGDENREDWREGIEQEDSDDLLPVTHENVVQYFKDLPDFLLDCKRVAEDAQYYLQARVAHIAGN